MGGVFYIFAFAGQIVVSGCTIEKLQATAYGGGFLQVGGALAVTDCSFRDVVSLGGCYIGGGGAVVLTRTVFDDTRSTDYAGAVYLVGGSATINSCNLTNAFSCADGAAHTPRD
eukprot:2255212-Prymnesium_polylepis.1